MSASDQYAHRLAFMLECALLDPAGAWDAAHILLDEYREAVRREHIEAGEAFVHFTGGALWAEKKLKEKNNGGN